MGLLETGVLAVQAVLAIASGIMIAVDTSHLAGWDRHQAMVFLGANSTFGSFLAAIGASASQSTDERKAGTQFVIVWVTMVCGGGFFVGAFMTHYVPGVVVFAPLTLLGAGGIHSGGMLCVPRPFVKVSQPISLVFACTLAYLSQTTMMFQLYSGVRWDEAIVNDWNARSADKYFACVERQLAGTAGDSWTATLDFVGIFL